MTVEQYSALVDIMPQIEKILEKKGEKIPRPKYEIATEEVPARDEEEQDHEESEVEARSEDEKPKAKNGRRKKANIEATSDEEEDD